MKFSFLTVKIFFFSILVLFLGCSEEVDDFKDETPPLINNISIFEGQEIEAPFQIVVDFNEDVNPNSLYGIRISGISADVKTDGSIVFVQIPAGAKPGKYTLVVSGVKDLAGNTMGAATSINFSILPPKTEGSTIEMLTGTWVVVLIDGESPNEICRSGLEEIEKEMLAGDIDCSYSVQFLFEEDKDFHFQILSAVIMDFGDPAILPIKVNIKQAGNGKYSVSGDTLKITVVSDDTTITIFPKELEELMKPDMEPLANELSEELFGDEKFRFTVVENYLTLKEPDGTEIIFKRK
jgi:hypothetical protein